MSAPRIAPAADLGVLATLRRGVRISPELIAGGWVTLILAVVAAAGRIVVPITVQRTVDTAILAPTGPDGGRVAGLTLLAGACLVVAGLCSALVNVRLFRSTEAGLANLRVRAFRHVHDLSMLTQGTERRGALVSRVTSDIDQITMFVQWGGIMLLVSTLQVAAATALMAVYSWQLTLVVWGCFLPLLIALRPAQRQVNRAYAAVRERTGAMLGAISEAVVGAETIRAYGVAARTARRIDDSVEATRRAQLRAQFLVSGVFTAGVLVSNLVLCAVVLVGVGLGVGGAITTGELLGFLFLIQLFTGPVQLMTEIVNELQNAVAGWRRALAILDTPVDVADSGRVASPRGPAALRFEGVRFAYPDGPEVLHGLHLDLPARTSVAVVGATGSGKTTIARLVTRLVDPTAGRVVLDGVDLRELTVASLRDRVVLVPQEGFLFDGTVAANVAYGIRAAAPPGGPRAVRARVEAAVDAVGLGDWVRDLPRGLDTRVGQRGEALSAGERQLVAILRAYVADADLLVLDEATSAVDPAAEVRIARALASLTAGRSTLTIAHRLSTAEAADVVVVVDAGRVVEFGPHAELAAAGGVYARMHAAWAATTR